jgi:uncharacterized protein (TIGR02597 family)
MTKKSSGIETFFVTSDSVWGYIDRIPVKFLPQPVRMKTRLLSIFALLAVTSGVFAQVYTAPVGFVSVTVPAASDAAIGAPLERATEFQGVVQSISGNVITVAGTPGWTTNQFVYVAPVLPAASTQPKTFYLRVDSDTKEGMVLPITANSDATLTVTIPSAENLTGVLTNAADGTGSSVSIAPYWTISSLVSGAIAGTQVFVTSTTTAGINLPQTTYTFNGTNWLRGSTVANDDILGVNQGILVRNNHPSNAVTLSVTGSVPMSQHRTRLATLAANTRQDIRLFYNSPVPEVIGNVFNVGTLSPGDQFLYINNAAVGKNKPTTTLVWNGTNWLQGSTPVTTTFSLQPGQSYVFRKNQSANPTSVVWADLQSYLQ